MCKVLIGMQLLAKPTARGTREGDPNGAGPIDNTNASALRNVGTLFDRSNPAGTSAKSNPKLIRTRNTICGPCRKEQQAEMAPVRLRIVHPRWSKPGVRAPAPSPAEASNLRGAATPCATSREPSRCSRVALLRGKLGRRSRKCTGEDLELFMVASSAPGAGSARRAAGSWDTTVSH